MFLECLRLIVSRSVAINLSQLAISTERGLSFSWLERVSARRRNRVAQAQRRIPHMLKTALGADVLPGSGTSTHDAGDRRAARVQLDAR